MKLAWQWRVSCADCVAPLPERGASVEHLADLQVQRPLVVFADAHTEEYRSHRRIDAKEQAARIEQIIDIHRVALQPDITGFDAGTGINGEIDRQKRLLGQAPVEDQVGGCQVVACQRITGITRQRQESSQRINL